MAMIKFKMNRLEGVSNKLSKIHFDGVMELTFPMELAVSFFSRNSLWKKVSVSVYICLKFSNKKFELRSGEHIEFEDPFT